MVIQRPECDQNLFHFIEYQTEYKIIVSTNASKAHFHIVIQIAGQRGILHLDATTLNPFTPA